MSLTLVEPGTRQPRYRTNLYFLRDDDFMLVVSERFPQTCGCQVEPRLIKQAVLELLVGGKIAADVIVSAAMGRRMGQRRTIMWRRCGGGYD